ncbi:MAG: sigma-70 family RNA polymerase sigma factor [Bryobacteraceae bacterium]|nr:sigma-70 family RNA polymerase sigma factor [Bryobacteraceae bacterium]
MISLLERIAGQDQGALEELCRQTRLSLLGRIRRILPDQHDAEEVLQDVYLQAWRMAPTFREERGGVSAWLFMIARTRAIDRLRRHRFRPESVGQDREWVDSGERPDQACLRHWREDWIASQIRGLAPGQRELLELSFYEGLSHSEIATRQGLPLGTVKTRIRAALERLRLGFQQS